MDFSQYGTPSPEWLAFIRACPQVVGFMPDKKNKTPAELRAGVAAAVTAANLNKLTALGLWDVVEAQDFTAPGREDGHPLPIRLYRPKAAHADHALPAFVYLHGGGYLFGDLNADEPLCVAWAAALNMAVVSLDYRHTPAATGLAAWHDAIDAFDWVATHAADKLGVDPARLVVGGISAGAGLAAAITVHEVQRAQRSQSPLRLRSQVLAIPGLSQDFPNHLFASEAVTSRVQNAHANVLNRDWLEYFYGLLHADTDVPRDHPTWNPVLTEEGVLRDMPPTSLLVAGGDVLRDDGLLYATRLRDAGAPTKVHVFDGMPHGFYVFGDLGMTKRWDEVMHESIRWTGAGDGEWVIERSSTRS